MILYSLFNFEQVYKVIWLPQIHICKAYALTARHIFVYCTVGNGPAHVPQKWPFLWGNREPLGPARCRPKRHLDMYIRFAQFVLVCNTHRHRQRHRNTHTETMLRTTWITIATSVRRMRRGRKCAICSLWWACLSVFRSLGLSVSLSVCLFPASTSPKLYSQTSHFLCMMPMAVARSSSGSVTIRYVFPVLWMTSFFHSRPYGGMSITLQRRCAQANAAAAWCWLLSVYGGFSDYTSLMHVSGVYN